MDQNMADESSSQVNSKRDWHCIATAVGAMDSLVFEIRFAGPDLWEVVCRCNSPISGEDSIEFGELSAPDGLEVVLESAAGGSIRESRQIRRAFRDALLFEGDAAGLEACFGRQGAPVAWPLVAIEGLGTEVVRTSYRSIARQTRVLARLADGREVSFAPPAPRKRVVDARVTTQPDVGIRVRIDGEARNAIRDLLARQPG